jgi:hypothetical protein
VADKLTVDLDVARLCRVLRRVASELLERAPAGIPLEVDYYWDIPEDQVYDPLSDPDPAKMTRQGDSLSRKTHAGTPDVEPPGGVISGVRLSYAKFPVVTTARVLPASGWVGRPLGAFTPSSNSAEPGAWWMFVHKCEALAIPGMSSTQTICSSAASYNGSIAYCDCCEQRGGR